MHHLSSKLRRPNYIIKIILICFLMLFSINKKKKMFCCVLFPLSLYFLLPLLLLMSLHTKTLPSTIDIQSHRHQSPYHCFQIQLKLL